MDFTHFTRRSFLHRLLEGGVICSVTSRTLFGYHDDDLQGVFREICANLVQLINEERSVEKVTPVELDELASNVATKHAEEMAASDFASHWSLNGLKPYMRYSFAGGLHATQENISAADNTWSVKRADLLQDTSYLHVRLYQESPPNDGHRRTILASQQTHVGIGLAVEHLRLRMVELFVARYLDITNHQEKVKRNEVVTFAGRLLKNSYSLQRIEIFYETTPTKPQLEWLRVARPYSLPDRAVVLRPKLPEGLTYADGSHGDFKLKSDGTFQTSISLFAEEPGIYTIVCWVKRSNREKPFPATQACVVVEN